MSLPRIRTALALALASLALTAGCAPQYDIVHDSWGTEVVKSKDTGKYALRNHDTQQIIAADLPYAEVGPASCGAILVKDASGKYGYIDEAGHVIVPPQYAYAEQMGQDGSLGFPEKARVQNDAGLTGVIDKSGKLVFPIEFKKIEGVRQTYFVYMVRPHGKFDLRHRETGQRVTLEQLNADSERGQAFSNGNPGPGPRARYETAEAFLFLADVIEKLPPEYPLDRAIVAHWRKGWGEILEWLKKNVPRQ